MTVMTLNLVEKQPAAMRRIIGKHLAVPRWQETCDYYNQMMERERLTVCFHAQLKQRHATMRFEEMNDVERERLVCAIDELRGAFSKRRQVGASEYAYIREGANKRGNSSRLTQSFHFFMFEPIFSPVNALNQPI